MNKDSSYNKKFNRSTIPHYLDGMDFLYHEYLVIPTQYGCYLNLNIDGTMWITIDFENDIPVFRLNEEGADVRILELYEAWELWNGYINKVDNIKKLIGKI